VYTWYTRLGGTGYMGLALLISICGSAGFTYSSFWLAEWGDATTRSYDEDGEPLSKSENNYYLNIYAVFCCIAVIASCSRTTVLVYFGISASREMHNLLLDGILRSPVSFFDSTPLGRILNRFTSDITNTDESLATNISFTLAMVAAIAGAVGAICYSTKGILAILFVPLGMIFYKMQYYFRKSNTELKRLDNISRSPIFAQFDQALVGVTSMRAYAEVQQFVDRFETSVDLNTSVLMMQQLVKWWISIRLEVIGGLVSCAIAALAVGWDGFLSDKYLSMSLSFSFALVSNMKWLVSISAEVEANMSSVERIKYYSDNLAVEEPESVRKQYKPVSDDWPQQGRIVASDIKMSYRTGPLVLKGINFDISPCEKIGIAGRTGCGKPYIYTVYILYIYILYIYVYGSYCVSVLCCVLCWYILCRYFYLPLNK
jgi:ATP-binding cassette subfamily C (CFTR/MRP) protein 1